MSEPYRYGIYEKALFKKPLPQLLEDAARAGFDNFELSLDETDERLGRLDWDWAERSSFRQTARDCGVQVYSTCFSGQRRFPMGTMDDEKRAYALKLMERAIQFCVDTGIRVLQVAGYDVYYEESSAETAKRYDEGLALSARMAERYGVLLGVEPVELYVTSVHKAMELVRAIGSPNLHVYPDAANLVTAGLDPIQEIRLGAGHMVGLHIRDATPSTCYNLPIGTGTLDFDGLFAALRELKFQHPILVELWYQDDPAGAAAVRDHLRFLKEKEMSAKAFPVKGDF